MQRDAEILRLRTLAAAALLFAGVTVGFVLGRMSVWLISSTPSHDTAVHAASNHNAAAPGPTAPPDTTSPATAQHSPEAPSPAGPAMVSPGPAVAPSRGSPTVNSAASGTGTQEPPKPVVAPNFRAAGKPPGSAGRNESTGDDEANRAPPIKLINPTQADAASATAAPVGKAAADPIESEADRQDIAACERRYSSFRRSDGTYQPFGGGPRQRCPMLR